nr:periplasmic nitrate reductase, NapE protein [Brucella pituitosa]
MREKIVPVTASQQVNERDKRFRRELLMFLVLAFGIWPIVAVGVVGGYGFIVWMFQLIYGPPGPPAH